MITNELLQNIVDYRNSINWSIWYRKQNTNRINTSITYGDFEDLSMLCNKFNFELTQDNLSVVLNQFRKYIKQNNLYKEYYF